MGRGDAEIRAVLNDLMRPYGMSVDGRDSSAGASPNEPSPKLRAIIAQLMCRIRHGGRGDT